VVTLRVVAEVRALENSTVVTGVDWDEFVFHRRDATSCVTERGAEADVVVAVTADSFLVALAAVEVFAVDDDEAKAAEFVGLEEEPVWRQFARLGDEGGGEGEVDVGKDEDVAAGGAATDVTGVVHMEPLNVVNSHESDAAIGEERLQCARECGISVVDEHEFIVCADCRERSGDELRGLRSSSPAVGDDGDGGHQATMTSRAMAWLMLPMSGLRAATRRAILSPAAQGWLPKRALRSAVKSKADA